MDLVADIGNTRTHLAAVDQGRIIARADSDDWSRFADSLAARPARLAIASVNPKVTEALVAWSREHLALEPRVIGESLRPRLAMAVDAPEQVGADRLVNGLWAARRLAGRPAVVVSFGTAISFAVVDAKGTFVGGSIAPGLSLQARALRERTALLPEVRPTAPPAAIGKNTAACIESGLFWGAVALVDRIAEKADEELGAKVVVVATGGDAPLLAPSARRIERVVPDLTLEGVAIALDEG